MMLLSQKLGILGGSTIALSIVFGFIAFDQILKFGIRDQTALRKRNEIRGIYLKLPFPLDFRVYFFNISNPEEVQKGAIPILKEVGPYCYDEFKEKIDVVDNDADDSLTYSPYDIFKFNPEKSGQLKDDDVVTILHPLIVGMVNQVTKDSPALLSIVNKAITSIFQDPKSIYLTAKVKDILFDGVEINCKVTEFSAKAVCTQLKSQIPGLKVTAEKNVFLFSILGTRNATIGKRFKVLKGISTSRNLGRVVEIDGQKELTMWGTQQCNRFKGTDGWIFPPLLTPEEGIWSFSTDLCRNVGAVFLKEEEFKGMTLRYYEANLGDMDHNEEEKCYCATPKTCLKKGVFDLTKCMGVPIYATLPHFLYTDEMYLKQVEGLNPLVEDHAVRIHFEPLSGTPVEARKRMQFNLPIAPNPKITLMNSIPEALHPIFWVEEGVELEGALLAKVKSIFLIIKISKILSWFGVAAGTCTVLFSGYLYFKRDKTVKITPVHEPRTVRAELEKDGGTTRVNSTTNENGNNKKGANSVLSGHEFDKY